MLGVFYFIYFLYLCKMKYEYTYISNKDFGQGMTQVSNLAKQGWRLISTVTRGGTYKFVLEKEEQ